MPHWKLTVAYDGTSFNGWQIQPSLPTVQGTLAQSLHRITGETVLPQGSGRTDTGVHALGQVVSVTLNSPIPASNLQRALNNHLPGSIRILSIEAAPPNFHARYSARRKTYEYRIAPQAICPPSLAPFVWNCTWPLDLAAMQQAAVHVIGEHDFASFAATDPDRHSRTGGGDSPPATLATRSSVRSIFASSWEWDANGLLIYRVTGSGFLHHMVRNLVGTFVDIGRGRILAEAVPSMLRERSRSVAGPTAPPQGLFLLEVEYDSPIIPDLHTRATLQIDTDE
jgi:tRNA pseudouridine38-40 synthase